MRVLGFWVILGLRALCLSCTSRDRRRGGGFVFAMHAEVWSGGWGFRGK